MTPERLQEMKNEAAYLRRIGYFIVIPLMGIMFAFLAAYMMTDKFVYFIACFACALVLYLVLSYSERRTKEHLDELKASLKEYQ